MAILTITLPIFLLIGLGYVCAWRRLFTPDQVRGMGRFVITIALPALLFRALVQQQLRDVLEWRYLLVYALGSLALLIGGFLYARIVHKQGVTSAALRGFGMSVSNNGFIGFPMAMQLIGPHAAVPLALTYIVENLVMLPTVLALAESGQAGHAPVGILARRIGLGLVKSPLVIAIVTACIGLVIGIHPIGPLAKVIDLLAGASAPVALLVIGASLFGLSAKGMMRPVLEISAAKLLIHPLAMIGLLMLIPIADKDLRHTVILLATIPMLSIYPIIAQRYGEEKFCGAALLVTTALAFATVSGWVWLLQAGYLG
ncbi:AEC family transporter [Sphingomonas sp. MMS24-J13]|uniref:AEC family transporter n=1 Tax=Sphingomonas sp. MMS24-J13 TaxID=3238686 RepID=UPI00384F1BBC